MIELPKNPKGGKKKEQENKVQPIEETQ